MATVRPFNALRPLPQSAASVSAVPYDVVNTEEARLLAAGNPLSFLHVSRPEIDLPPGTDIYSDTVYNLALENFQGLRKAAPLVVEDRPAFYLYRLTMDGRSQTGLVACCSVDEYDRDIVKKHEKTRKDKEDDRTRHILTIKAQTGPVFLAYRGSQDISAILDPVKEAAPLFDFTSVDGIGHTIWLLPAELNHSVVEAFANVPEFYIADGHHRAKSASRAAEALAEGADAESRFFQCVLFPDSELKILAYNRAVKDLNGMDGEEFLERVRFSFEVRENAAAVPAERGSFSMYTNGKWYGLRLRSEATTPLGPVDRLDVSVLQDRLLAPVLGVGDPRTDKRIDFIGGIRGTAELERLVDSGIAAVAFSMFPTTLAELMEISDAGEIMPPKSTWFEPKLRDGLLSHLI